MPGIEKITSLNSVRPKVDDAISNEAFEIELESEDVELEEEDSVKELPQDLNHFDNLVPYLDEKVLTDIGLKVVEGYNADNTSRAEWLATIEKGMKLLGLKIEDLNEPFQGACSAVHPLILESAIKFQSKASLELFPPNGPVKTKINAIENDELQKQAHRVKEYLNFIITERMPEYYSGGERLLFAVALTGTVFRKIRYSIFKDRPFAEVINYKNFVIADTAKSLEDQERYTHVVPMTSNEMLRAIACGEFQEPVDSIYPDQADDGQMDAIEDLKGFVKPQDDRSKTYRVLEQHVNLSLPSPFENSYDIADPYIVCVDEASGKVLSVVRNWEETDDEMYRKKIEWFEAWHFVPGTGFHSFGYIHLLGNLQLSLTTILRSLVDSGQFANLQGGFKLKGVKIGGGDVEPISPGEFRDIEANIDDINKAIKPLPFKEPSQVLYQMLSFIEGRSQQFADSTEAIVNDATNYGPVGTTMALLEASTKFYSAIHKRLHFSQKRELKLISRILRDNVRDTGANYPEGFSFEQDFADPVVIIPVSDPNIPTAAHRMMIANAALDIASKVPDIANKREAVRAALFAMGNVDVDKIIPPEDKVQPLDPVSDIQMAVSGKPIKAFPGQEHDAHIQIKTLWLEDPTNGANPIMQQTVPAVVSNIRDHMMLKYREQLAGAIQNMDPAQVSEGQSEEYVIALAAEQVKQINEQIAANGAAEDPLRLAAQAEMLRAQTEENKLEHKKVTDFATLAQGSQKLALDVVREQNRHLEKKVQLGITKKTHDFNAGSKMIDSAIKNVQRQAIDTKGEKK